MITIDLRKKKYLKFFLYSAAALTIVLLYYFFDAREERSFFPHCPFNTLTGLYCPGCGSQRVLTAILHGDIISAVKYNVLAVIAIPFLLYSLVVFIHNVFYKKQLQQRFFYSPVFVRIVLISVLAFWVLRNIPIFPFTLLAPH
jgi:hypothetical protein